MLDIIYNEKSGSGKGKRTRKKLEKFLQSKNVSYTFHKTSYKRHATKIAEELCKNGATDVIAMGGDGTINEVLNGIDVNKVNFGIIPCGSGNDFIHSAKIPKKSLKALEVILTETPKPTDYMDCSGVKGLNIIGTGIDVEILKRCEKYKIIKGKLQYAVSLIVSLIKFNFYRMKVFTETETFPQNDTLIVCACNGKQFGGGIKICPDAQIDDGEMDLVVANKMKKIKVPGMFIKLMSGKVKKITEKGIFSFTKHNRVTVEFDKPTPIQIDGEIFEDLPFDVTLVKNGLRLYRP